jgi:DNA topoisomerase IA
MSKGLRVLEQKDGIDTASTMVAKSFSDDRVGMRNLPYVTTNIRALTSTAVLYFTGRVQSPAVRFISPVEA